MVDTAADLTRAAARAWVDLRRAAPRVQALTNTVAQALTANVLLAAGARVSLATHAAEIVDMTSSAGAVLINLGTLDDARVAAIPWVVDALAGARIPVVLDPVFVEHSAVRRNLAARVLSLPQVIVKGNAGEMAALAGTLEQTGAASGATRITTGAVDQITMPDGRRIELANGHPRMTEVTAIGCATGALIAAFAAVSDDAAVAAVAALLGGGIAGEIAAEQARGPAEFAIRWVDAIARLDAATLLARARITMERPA